MAEGLVATFTEVTKLTAEVSHAHVEPLRTSRNELPHAVREEAEQTAEESTPSPGTWPTPGGFMVLPNVIPSDAPSGVAGTGASATYSEHQVVVCDRSAGISTWWAGVSLSCAVSTTPACLFHYEKTEEWLRTLCSRGLRTKLLLVMLSSTMTWAISFVLSAIGLSAAKLYLLSFDWGAEADDGLFLSLVGGIFTGWNVAQYASYAIQTTGHHTLQQHLRALLTVGPTLVLCNGLGWALGCVSITTHLGELHLAFRVLIVGAPPIVLGIFAKTLGKTRYMFAYSTAYTKAEGRVVSPPPDSFGQRLSIESMGSTEPLPECPFRKLGFGHVLTSALGPLGCAVWVVMYVLALRLAYCWAAMQGGSLTVVLQLTILAVSLAIFFAGEILLTRWIMNSTGYYGYGTQMLLAFYLIYFTVSDVQVRLGIVQMEGLLRLFCSGLQPLAFTFIRYRIVTWWRSVSEDPAKSPYHQERPRLVIACVISMLTQNVSAALVSGTACIFKDVQGVNMGSCSHGFWMQIVIDCCSTWVLDCVGFALYMRIQFPSLYVFVLLDPFLVIAAVVVVYLNVMLALLAGKIQL